MNIYISTNWVLQLYSYVRHHMYNLYWNNNMSKQTLKRSLLPLAFLWARKMMLFIVVQSWVVNVNRLSSLKKWQYVGQNCFFLLECFFLTGSCFFLTGSSFFLTGSCFFVVRVIGYWPKKKFVLFGYFIIIHVICQTC